MQLLNVSYKIGQNEILKNISFEIPKNKIIAFAGSNGAGKTTTIKLMTELYKKQSGSINLCSKNEIGYVPEKENFPKMILEDFLFWNMGYFNIDKKQTIDRLNKLLNVFDIENLLHKDITKFSSGQKKKILIIQALLSNPKLLIMDEPTDNLDVESRISFYKIINDFVKLGGSVFLSTHQLDEVGKYANVAILIHKGQIVGVENVSKENNLLKIYEKKIIEGKYEKK